MERVSDERLAELIDMHRMDFRHETVTCLRELQRRRASVPKRITPDLLSWHDDYGRRGYRDGWNAAIDAMEKAGEG